MKGEIEEMIIGRMTSRLDANFFGREGYSSHKPPKSPPDTASMWPCKKFAVFIHEFWFWFLLIFFHLGKTTCWD
jgi:hypothetical protein